MDPSATVAAHEVAFSFNLVADLDADPDGVWDRLSMLCPAAVLKGGLEDFWAQEKALRPSSVVKVLFKEGYSTGSAGNSTGTRTPASA